MPKPPPPAAGPRWHTVRLKGGRVVKIAVVRRTPQHADAPPTEGKKKGKSHGE